MGGGLETRVESPPSRAITYSTQKDLTPVGGLDCIQQCGPLSALKFTDPDPYPPPEESLLSTPSHIKQ